MIALVVVFWASAFVGIRVAIAEYGPGSLALTRFAAASLVLLAASSIRGYRGRVAARVVMPRPGVPSTRRLFAYAGLGATGIFGYNLALNAGERVVDAGTASLLVNTVPIWTALLGATFLGERFGVRARVGVAVAFLGSAWITGGEARTSASATGVGLVLLASILQAIYFVGSRRVASRDGAFTTITWTIWTGTLLLLPFASGAIADVQRASATATAAAIYLGVFPSALGYALWVWVLSKMPAGRATGWLYLVPVAAVTMSGALLGERPGASAIAGGVITIAGVWIAARDRSVSRPRDESSAVVAGPACCGEGAGPGTV